MSDHDPAQPGRPQWFFSAPMSTKAAAVLKAEQQGVISKKEAALSLQNLGVLRREYGYEADQKRLHQARSGPLPPRDMGATWKSNSLQTLH